jgi:hypothetical protein
MGCGQMESFPRYGRILWITPCNKADAHKLFAHVRFGALDNADKEEYDGETKTS